MISMALRDWEHSLALMPRYRVNLHRRLRQMRIARELRERLKQIGRFDHVEF